MIMGQNYPVHKSSGCSCECPLHCVQCVQRPLVWVSISPASRTKNRVQHSWIAAFRRILLAVTLGCLCKSLMRSVTRPASSAFISTSPAGQLHQHHQSCLQSSSFSPALSHTVLPHAPLYPSAAPSALPPGLPVNVFLMQSKLLELLW